jgi:hypothetical protein
MYLSAGLAVMHEDADIPKAAVGEWAERNAERRRKLVPDTWRGDLGAGQVRRSRQRIFRMVSGGLITARILMRVPDLPVPGQL